MSRCAIGIDLGGTKVGACLVGESRRILARKRQPSEPLCGREKVVGNILELIAETAAGAPYKAVGMGTPGTYHPGDDIMYGAPHTPLYEKPGLISLLRSELPVPLVIENDANYLALAEFFAQCCGKYSTVMAVSSGLAWAQVSSSITDSTAAPTGTPARSAISRLTLPAASANAAGEAAAAIYHPQRWVGTKSAPESSLSHRN